MEYSKTKRDIEMHHRRKETLRMPDSPLTEIILEKYQVNEQRIDEVVQILQSPQCIVETLVIKQNQFTDILTRKLADAIRINKSLNSIEIERCRLRNTQLAEFCLAVSDHDQMVDKEKQRINSSYKVLPGSKLFKHSGDQDPKSIKYIENFSLKQLRINMEGADAICKLLKDCLHLKSLHLIDAGLDCDTLKEICKGIDEKVHGLEYLDLKHNIFDKRGLNSLIKSLKASMNIKHLYLESMMIHEEEAMMLSEFIKQKDCQLEELEINEADINVEAIDMIMEALYQRDTLKRLSLAKNELNLTICQHLSQLPSSLHQFQSLSLSHCLINEDGLKSLCSGFSGDVSIKYLDLSWNNISGQGMQYILEMLKENKSLRKLYIQHNQLGEIGAKQMVQALIYHPQMKYLDISANDIGAEGFAHFKVLFEQNSTLRNLHVRKNGISGDEISSFPLCLMKNHNLRYLDIRDNNFDNEFGQNLLKVLEKNIAIEDLDVHGNNYMSFSLRETLIEQVKMNLLIKEYIINQIENNQSMVGIPSAGQKRKSVFLKDMNQNEIKFINQSFLRSNFICKFMNLNKFYLRILTIKNVMFMDHMIDMIEFLHKDQPQLKVLTIDSIKERDESIHDQIKPRDLGVEHINQLIDAIKKIQSLEELNIINMPKFGNLNSKNQAGHLVQNNVLTLRIAFQNHNNLKILNLSNNGIRDMQDLAELININKNLQSVNISNNIISSPDQFNYLLEAMSENISINEFLYTIDSKTKEIDENVQQFLVRQINKNKFISQLIQEKKWTQYQLKNTSILDISDAENVIKDLDGAFKLFRCLKVKKHFILKNCNLDDSSVYEMITYILHFKIDIETLDLSNNKLTAKGCEFLTQMIGKSNHPIKNIKLNQNNNIGTDGLMKILNSIQRNTHLEVLELKNCGISLKDDNDINTIKRYISKNCTLQKLNIEQNDINNDFLIYVNNELQQNQKINSIIFKTIKEQNKQMIQKVAKRQHEREQQNAEKIKREFENIQLAKAGKRQSMLNFNSRKLNLKPIQRERASSADLAESQSSIQMDDIKIKAKQIHTNASDQNGDKIEDSLLDDLLQDEEMEDQGQVLSLRGKGLTDLTFLEKFMRENQNQVLHVDIGDNDIKDRDLKNFIDKGLKNSSQLASLNIKGLRGIKAATKTSLKRELNMNKLIKENISTQKIQDFRKAGNLTLRSMKLNNIGFLQKFLHQNVDLKRLKIVDLGDNNLGKENADEICHLIELPDCKIEKLIINNNRIGSSGLQHICSSLVSNTTILELDISHNNIDDASYKILYQLLQKNTHLYSIKYSLSNETNIQRQTEFDSLIEKNLSIEKIEEKFIEEADHDEELKTTWKQKLCLPLWCWRSFIHDKHEAFRFKYATKELNTLETQMHKILLIMYLNSFIYYIFIFVLPFVFVLDCGEGMNPITHIIYGVFSIYSFIMEIVCVIYIQNKLHNPNILKFNKWHVVEIFMGQIARFDTYLDVCFLSLLWQCSVWHLVIPVGVLILIYCTYPLISMYRLSGWARDQSQFKHTLPNIERCCKLSFIRENMLIATVLDSFCVVNNNEVCSINLTMGRAMAIWTMLTQDGPQYLIHLLFIFVFHTEVSHSEITVLMSLVISTLAVGISTFNIIMCAPNEFDPVVLQIELRKRYEEKKQEDLKLKNAEKKLSSMFDNNQMKLQSGKIINKVSGIMNQSKVTKSNDLRGSFFKQQANIINQQE